MSSPQDGDTDVPLDALISMRFSKPLLVPSINEQTVLLQGPEGVVPATIVAAESGMLAFTRPKTFLVAGTSYTVTFSGGTDVNRSTFAFTQFTFITSSSHTFRYTNCQIWAAGKKTCTSMRVADNLDCCLSIRRMGLSRDLDGDCSSLSALCSGVA